MTTLSLLSWANLFCWSTSKLVSITKDHPIHAIKVHVVQSSGVSKRETFLIQAVSDPTQVPPKTTIDIVSAIV